MLHTGHCSYKTSIGAALILGYCAQSHANEISSSISVDYLQNTDAFSLHEHSRLLGTIQRRIRDTHTHTYRHAHYDTHAHAHARTHTHTHTHTVSTLAHTNTGQRERE